MNMRPLPYSFPLASVLFLSLSGCAGTPTETKATNPGETGDIPEDSGSDVACTEVAAFFTLEAVRATSLPVLDGEDTDAVWDCLPWIDIDVIANVVYTPTGSPSGDSYPGLTTTSVTMKSVYTDSDVYFLVAWGDPEKSLMRYPWEKQTDGTWVQLSNKDSSGHENTFYEDKFAVQWNIDSASFAATGCYAGCHTGTDNANPGKKYYPEDETTDMWHWKSVRTEPNGQLDDKYVTYIASGECDGENCRLGDSRESGGYVDNNFGKFDVDCAGDPDGTLSVPCFMGPSPRELLTEDKTWVLDAKKQPFVDGFESGDRIAGMITSAFVGSRADVSTKAAYVDGTWTLEIRRSLITSTPAEDVQFDDLSRTYKFGVAVFDNTQINHASHAGALDFIFRP